ncbi:AlpA family phage regulatory protein [Bradyrhizobium sp. AUGA SZCCT0169]|uniref:helix-turn-helix transcriptional regulator n=1 Tax=Bradyrhizobium sp. AUGA SZCCT0169 TaxID=2807663 RepID=UPI001BABF253|nr:AlpA family phage regulatory protein [Bradyrhizobium sp. AUGA SZCCT0169]MBR1251340.1 AlpA family phage regulatory protein [Bradyrhizobium sp. AUGA SZCCT0169]
MSEQTPWMRRPEIKSINPVADQTLERAEDAGLFPKRIYLAPKVAAWRRADVLDWLNDPSAWVQRHQSSVSRG